MSGRLEFWARHIEAQQRSGKTQRGYCVGHGLRPRNFRRWAQRLARMSQSSSPPDGLASHSASTRTSTRTSEVLLPDPVGEVLIAREPRRRWTEDQKRRLVEETFAPGSSVSRVSRRYGVHTSALFRWRRQLAGPQLSFKPAVSSASAFAAVQVAPEPHRLPPPTPAELSRLSVGTMEIELTSGHRIRVDRDVDASALRRVVAALAPG